MKHFIKLIFFALGDIFCPSLNNSELDELISNSKNLKVPTVRENWESVWEYFIPFVGK